MKRDKPIPGVSRSERLSEDGLERLRRQLAAGVRLSEPVLAQWVLRYGDAARDVILEYTQAEASPGRSE